ncbi:MAG: energy-coupling factor ABC transporter permease [Andreesenia angusta]|nr:energy-coupling factor ABC transporter permease [Andreesenia angusta]
MKQKLKTLYFLIAFMLISNNSYAMHIAEGVLPISHALIYFIICIPFFILGIRDLKNINQKSKNTNLFIALAGAYCFVLSALKLPSVTGSCSHPTGVGFGAIVLGPYIMTVIGVIVLLFQAIFLAHGGLTTLGANTFSMGIIGPIVAFLVYKLFRKKNKNIAIFLAAALGDLLTYVITSLQLGIAFPSVTGGILASVEKFGAVFAITQIPLAIAEGILTVFLFNIIEKYSKSDLDRLMEVQYDEK